MNRQRRIELLLLTLSVVILASTMPAGGVKTVLPALLTWIGESGIAGVLLFWGLYVVCAVCFVPLLPLNTAAGFLWGPLRGLAIVVPANLLGGLATFALGRSFCRTYVERTIEGNRRLSAVGRAVRRSGLRFVCLLKLSPVCPFAIVNYALGVTPLRMRDFLVASLAGAIPGTVMYIWIGSLLNGVTDVIRGRLLHTSQFVYVLAGMVPMAVAVGMLIRATQRELIRQTAETS